MSKKTYIGILSVFCCIALFFIDCKHSTEPEEIKPGRRDYTWFVDTVYAGGNMIIGFAGVSPTDVWAISNPGEATKTFYHFNGSQWSTDNVNRTIVPSAIYAVASNDVWSVGLSGDIWHYDGNSWISKIRVTADSTFCSLEAIDGYSSSNIYASGFQQGNTIDLHSFMYHYNGSTWSRVSVPDVICSLCKIRLLNSGNAVIIGFKNQNSSNSTDTNKILIFNGNALQQLYSGVNGSNQIADIASISEGVLMLEGRKLLLFDGANQNEIMTIENSEFGYSIEGRTTKDVFLGMWDGIAHYNGTDIQYLYRFTDSNIRMDFMKVFPNTIFVNTYNSTTQTNIIFRGYLK